MAKDIGVQSVVWADGKDITHLLNSANQNPSDEAVQDTTFRTPDYVHTFIQGIGTSTLSLGGFMPTILSEDNAQELLARTLGNRSEGQEIMVGVSGFEIGHMVFIAKSLRTTLGAQIQSAGIMALSADFQVTSGSPGLCAGVCLLSPHGSALAPGVDAGEGRAVYRVISATENGAHVTDIAADATSETGLEAMIQTLAPDGEAATLTVKIQHAPDDAGDPGEWADLVTFDAMTASGVQRKSVAPGVEINPHLRAIVSAIDGDWVAVIAAARH